MVDIEAVNAAMSTLAYAKDRYNEALAEAVKAGITVEVFLPDREKFVAKPGSIVMRQMETPKILTQRLLLELHP